MCLGSVGVAKTESKLSEFFGVEIGFLTRKFFGVGFVKKNFSESESGFGVKIFDSAGHQYSPIEFFSLELEEKIALLTADKAKLQLSIQGKEHHLLASVQAAREDEWKKISEITNEK